jgi:trimeric autotransporter adhesin
MAPSGSASAPPASGEIQVIAGGGPDAPANGLAATAVRLLRPLDVAFDPDGTLWIVDGNAALLLHVLADGTLADVTAGALNPSGVTVTPNGTVYIGDRGNYRIDSYDGQGGLDVVAGDTHFPGSSGDGGPFGQALFSQPTDIVSDAAGNLYINDLFNEKVRWVDAETNIIDRLAGNGTAGFSGDGGPARDAQINAPQALAVDRDGTQLLIADTRNQRLRRVDLIGGTIETIAGTGGPSGTFDPALTAASVSLARLSALALDGAGNIYLPLFWGDKGLVIERLAPDGQLTLVAGGGTTTSGGVAPLEFLIQDVLCLEVNPATGDLLFCAPDGHIYSVPAVARPPAGP